MKIAVVGAGAMGSLFGGKLAESGADVILVDVDKLHVAAIQERGLALDEGSGPRQIPVKATLDPTAVGSVDLIILFCKYVHTRDAINAARPMLRPHTYVWTLQNGIGNVDIIRETVAPNRIAKGLTSITAIAVAPGHVTSNFAGTSETFAWPLDNQTNPTLEAATQLLTKAGLPAFLAPDIDYRIWRKLVVNTTLTVLSAAVNVGIGPVGENEPGQRLFRAIVGEVVAVAKANKVPLNFDDAIGYVEELRQKAFEHVGSTTVDLQRGRKTEIDAMNGAVVREGRRLGVPTPTNEVVAEMIRLIEASRPYRLPNPI